MGISTHVLDTAGGRPAAGVAVTLERRGDDGCWHRAGDGITDDDGRVGALLAEGAEPAAGVYRLTFHLEPWFAERGVDAFYPLAAVVFRVREPAEHHHVPLLLAPYGYSTYRGS